MATRNWISPDDLDDPTSRYAEDAVIAASYVLFALSGRKYGGVFTVTESYRCETSSGPVYLSGSTLNTDLYEAWSQIPAIVLGHGDGSCGCNQRIRLRGRPVKSIDTIVTAASAVISPTTYRLIDKAIVEFITPVDLSDCGGGVAITYSYGATVPKAGRIAARILANELVKAKDCPDECQLPTRVTSVSRQGVSYTILDPQEFLDKGRTGIYEIDLFLQATNPARALKKPRVFSPDLPRGSRIG